MNAKAYPLDLQSTAYSYVERANPAILALVAKHLGGRGQARILDIGCGCGANARAIKRQSPNIRVVGIEPGDRAADLARASCDEVFHGTFDEWTRATGGGASSFDAVVLSDVLEHIGDPIPFVRNVAALEALRGALWVVSVPNYAVWYNRLNTLLGLQRYAWSGLWDRTHLRFYTRRTVRELLEYCGLAIVDEASTPSLVQWGAPVLRKFFDRDLAQGNHLALADSGAYGIYQTFVEPLESRICSAWPALLGFQVVHVARRATG